MKKSMRLMWPFLILIILSGVIVVRMNIRYNSEEHLASLESGCYSDSDISINLVARGAGTDEVATWDYQILSEDEEGNEIKVPGIGTIYEFTIVNKSDSIINDWSFRVTVPEDTYLNSGWNGVFNVHQFTGSDSPLEFSTSDFDMTDAELEYSFSQGCLLIPLEKGDWFNYTPSEKADEMPVPATVKGMDEPYSKTIGFILYFETEDLTHLADFTDCTVSYHLYRSIKDDKAFKGVCIALILWLMGVAEIHILYLHTKKLVRQQKRNMKIINESMETFANFIDAKDPNTKGHSVRVAHYSRLIAEKLGMKEEECQDIYYIGLLHDCGKISIPQEILMKPGRLTDEEYSVMKSHSQKGFQMLENFTSIASIGEGAYSHHERYDGRGYPRGLKGEEIPLIGRIICIADAFDAMNSKRCYRDKLDRDVIISELEKNRGVQFDPDITDIFLGMIESGEIQL